MNKKMIKSKIINKILINLQIKLNKMNKKIKYLNKLNKAIRIIFRV